MYQICFGCDRCRLASTPPRIKRRATGRWTGDNFSGKNGTGAHPFIRGTVYENLYLPSGGAILVVKKWEKMIFLL